MEEEKKIYERDLEEEALQPQNIVATYEPLDERFDVSDPNAPSKQAAEHQHELKDLKDMLQGDPHNAAIYQKIIEHYKSLALPNMVHETRVQAAENSSLTLEMWADWIESDKTEATTFSERVRVSDTFERALDCFNCNTIVSAYRLDYEIVKAYAEHVLALYNDPENDGSFGPADVKKVMDRVLRVWVLDFSRSTEIWQLALQFELDSLKKLAPDQPADAKYDSPNEPWHRRTQKERSIRGLYRQKLSFPSIDLDEVWEEYQTWEQDKDELEKMRPRHQKSTEKVQAFIKFEDNLAAAIQEFEKTNSIA